MRVIITGASGTLGTAVGDLLRSEGHDVYAMVRRSARTDHEVEWDPAAGTVDGSALARVAPEAVVHLAGESIDSRWNEARKRAIAESRTVGTATVARAIAALPERPSVLVCASAVGYYGDRGGQELTEDAAPGTGFLAGTCVAWEAAADPARDAGIRTVHLRLGSLQTRKGGALAKVLLPFKLGIGGPLGKPGNYMAVVSLRDAARAVSFAIGAPSLSGAANVAIPEPATQRSYARAVGRALHRPALLPVPGFALRIVAGEMAGELLLVSQRVVPARLSALGFRFEHPTVQEAVEAGLAD